MNFQNITYTSNPIDIPNDFLTSPPAQPVSVHHIDFASSPLPEYNGLTAFIIDGALTEAECRKLISLAEASVPLSADAAAKEEAASPWRPALVSAGPGMEMRAEGYRESDRIIWDRQEMVDRIWERCLLGEGVREVMGELDLPRGKWVFKRGNERMRFLKYGKGQYFKPHCDAPYYDQSSKEECRTFFTLHLYLNNSAEALEASGPEASWGNSKPEFRGGATAFLSSDNSRALDVHPKAGSVLIFQHAALLHEGSVVESGTKYTLRTDLMYELRRKRSR